MKRRCSPPRRQDTPACCEDASSHCSPFALGSVLPAQHGNLAFPNISNRTTPARAGILLRHLSNALRTHTCPWRNCTFQVPSFLIRTLCYCKNTPYSLCIPSSFPFPVFCPSHFPLPYPALAHADASIAVSGQPPQAWPKRYGHPNIKPAPTAAGVGQTV